VRQVQGPLDIKLLAGVVNVSVPEVMPFYTSGQIDGLTQGLRGAAEYELLVNKPGSAVAKMDAQSLGHLAIILFVIIGNIAYFTWPQTRGSISITYPSATSNRCCRGGENK
jgi:hypothetical protein